MIGTRHRRGSIDPQQSPDRSPARLRSWIQRRGQWLLLAIGLLSLVTFLSLTQPLPRVDQLLQDSVGAAMVPPSDDIVIVAIDEKSLAAIGHWPWRRSIHAELLRRIAAQSPRCIGLNLMFDSPDAEHPGDDATLAQAMRDSGCVVLPMSVSAPEPQDLRERLPAPVLAEAAAGLGHTHFAIDQDGVIRSLFLHEGFSGRMRPHFALALHDAARGHTPSFGVAIGCSPGRVWETGVTKLQHIPEETTR